MKFAIIVPDRGDRPELASFCLKQISRFTVQPDAFYHIKHRPETERFDLISRVHQGLSMAHADGMEWAVIIENDDYYPENYISNVLAWTDKYDFIGCEQTTYYNLSNQTHNTFDHKFRSSLFTTAIRISALNNFEWPDEHSPFLDISLWKYARYKRRKFIPETAIGIKHNLGLCGGKGHKMRLKNQDPDMSWLRNRVDDEAFEFYTELSGIIKTKAV